MPVVSPRRSSASLTGSYRTSNIDRPLFNGFAPRTATYSERFCTKIYSDSDGRTHFIRQASITEDGITTRFCESDSGSSSTRETSIIRDNSSSRLSAISVAESVAEMRQKYSPSNYVPACARKNINKVNAGCLNNGETRRLSNTTNLEDDNGNVAVVSVAEIRRRFDGNSTTNGRLSRGDKSSDDRSKRDTSTVKSNSCGSKSKVLDGTGEPSQNGDTASANNLKNNESPADFAGDFSKRLTNHTNNFASFIPYKDEPADKKENNDMENRNLIGENRESGQYYQTSKLNDITTPTSHLNRVAAGTSNAPANNYQRPAVGNDAFYDKPSATKNQGLNGLKNIGNTCFMNSVIQCLSNTKLLMEYVKNEAFVKDINTSISSMKGALIKAFSQVIKELWSEDSSDRVVNTLSLKSQIQRFAPRFMGYSQQDAQEFLRYLLEGLHEDVNRVVTKPQPAATEIDEKLSDPQKAAEAWQRYLRMDNSKIVDLFVGQLKSTLRCTHCGHCSVTFDPFWDLSLPIPQRVGPLRLQQCLESFTREETLDGDEKPTCSKCKERRKCTKSFAIQKFPKILVIHLKRFSPTERFRGKLSITIDFPIDGLDMRDYAAETNAGECRYNLYAISNHSGTTYSGHYTAYCRHPYSYGWHEYNDSRVCSISPKALVSGEAYVLFYELESQKKSHL